MSIEDIKNKELQKKYKDCRKELVFLCKAIIESGNNRDILRLYAKNYLSKNNLI